MIHTFVKYLSLPLEVLHQRLREEDEPHMKQTLHYKVSLCMIYECTRRMPKRGKRERQGERETFVTFVGVCALQML